MTIKNRLNVLAKTNPNYSIKTISNTIIKKTISLKKFQLFRFPPLDKVSA